MERGHDASLIGKPVAVVQYNPFGDLKTLKPSDNRIVKSGGIIAVSYEARARGVKRIMRGAEAIKVCPEIILVQVPVAHGKADLTIYREAGDRVVKLLISKGCKLEKASIDEVYLDLTQEVTNRMSKLSSHTPPPDKNPQNSDRSETFADILRLASSSLVAGEDESELKLDKQAIRNGHCGTNYDSTNNNSIIQLYQQQHEANHHNSDPSSRPIAIPYDYQRMLVGAAIVADLRKAVREELGYSCSGMRENYCLYMCVHFSSIIYTII